MRALILLCAAALPITAHAQRATPAGVRANDNVLAVGLQRASRADSQTKGAGRAAYEMPVRALVGVGGAFAGAFGGGLIGANYIPHAPCSCDDPGLAEALEGAMVGSIVASAVLAAAPQFSSSCGPLRRFGYGVGGAVAGAAVGGVLGATMGGPGVVFGYLGGSGIGAGVASGLCR